MFFIYFNKANKIVSPDIQNFTTWVQGIELNLHGFNIFPVDGTKLIWLHGKYRILTLPIDPILEAPPRGLEWKGSEI